MSSASTSDHREQLYLHDRISQLEDDNYRLRKREEASKASLSDSSVNETQLKASLTKAYKDLVGVHLRPQWQLCQRDATEGLPNQGI